MSIEVFFFIAAAMVAFMPTILDMKVKGKKLNWWKGLTIYGKIYIIAFASFFGTGLYLTIQSHNESLVKEITSKNRIKSDSISMSNLTVKVTKLYLSDSLYRSAINSSGFKYDSINGIILNSKVNVGKDGSAVVNYASNQGLQAGRDINLTTSEKVWSDNDLRKLLTDMKKFADINNISKVIFALEISISYDSFVMNQIKTELKNNGYTIIDFQQRNLNKISNNKYDLELNGDMIQVNINSL